MYAAVFQEVFVTSLFSEAEVLFNPSCYVAYENGKTGNIRKPLPDKCLIGFILHILTSEGRSGNDMCQLKLPNTVFLNLVNFFTQVLTTGGARFR
jgi:hypothetical protein